MLAYHSHDVMTSDANAIARRVSPCVSGRGSRRRRRCPPRRGPPPGSASTPSPACRVDALLLTITIKKITIVI